MAGDGFAAAHRRRRTAGVIAARYLAFIPFGLYRVDLAVRRLARPVSRSRRGRRLRGRGARYVSANDRSATSRARSSLSTRCSARPRSPSRGSLSAPSSAAPAAARPHRPAHADRGCGPHRAEPPARAPRDGRRARRSASSTTTRGFAAAASTGRPYSVARTRSQRSSRERRRTSCSSLSPTRPANARRDRGGVRRAGVACRFVRRETDLDPRVVLAPPPSDGAHRGSPRRARARSRSRVLGARRARVVSSGRREPEDADGLQRRARMGAAFACDRRTGHAAAAASRGRSSRSTRT